MQANKQKIWQKWAKKLQQLGLQDFTVALFESTGPLKFIGAQMIYLSQPVLSTFVGKDQLIALAEILEEPKNSENFLEFLLEETG